MAAIMADATNSGAEQMPDSSRGVTVHWIMLMIERHVRRETYAAATRSPGRCPACRAQMSTQS